MCYNIFIKQKYYYLGTRTLSVRITKVYFKYHYTFNQCKFSTNLIGSPNITDIPNAL